jgi:REP element-mobilizing transposase RayT
VPYDPTRHHRRTIRLRGYDYTQPGWYFVTICTHRRARLFADAGFAAIAGEQWHALRYAGARGAYAVRVVIDAWVVMPDHVHGLIGITTPITPSVSRPSITPTGAPGAAYTPGAPGAAYTPGAPGATYTPGAPGATYTPGAPGATHGGAQQPQGDMGTGWCVGAAAPLRIDDIVDHIDDIVDHIDVGGDRGDDHTGGNMDGHRDGLGIGVAAGSLGAIVRSYKAAVTRRINRRRRTPAARVWQRGYWERIIRDERHLERVRRYIASNPERHAAQLDALLARMKLKD